MANEAEIRLATSYGADAVGLVGPQPSGPGTLTEEAATGLVPSVPPGVSAFFLTSGELADAVAEQARRVGADTVQLVRHVAPAEAAALRRALPDRRIVQVIHVEDEGALGLIDAYAKTADAFLLDSGRPGLATPELGGTGRTHDWAVSAQIVRASPLPVFLAGGLTPANVAEAIETVAPYGVDLCSGVRTGGRLDEEKLAAFVAAVDGADRTRQ